MSPWGTVDHNKYMSRADAVKALGIPFERIKPMIDRGQLEGYQRGKVWYVSRASVAAYIKKRGF